MKAGIQFPVQAKCIYLKIFGQSLYIWKNWNDTFGIFYCMPLCQSWSGAGLMTFVILFVLDCTCSRTPTLNKKLPVAKTLCMKIFL